MIIPVNIHHHELEELCYYDQRERAVLCADYNSRDEYSVDEIELEYHDLVDIVEQNFDDIIDIILKDKQLTKLLLKRMARKIDILSVTDFKH